MKNYINKIKSLVLVGAASMALSSCGDFLYIEPKTFVSEENFWNERADIDQMVAGTYVKMQAGDFMTRLIAWSEMRSDDIKDGRDATNNLDLYRTLKEDLKSTNNYCDWSSFYAVIGQCNIIIDRCDLVAEKDPTFTHSDVMATKAEMAALRDLCYFYLVRAFKDVPYYTYPILADADIQPMPAVDGDKIVKSLIADLDTMAHFALKAFPEDRNSDYNSSRNRITQSAIYAILADLCLWDGQYQRAVDYCQEVIDYKLREFDEIDNLKYSNLRSDDLAKFRNEEDTYNKSIPLYPCYEDKTFGTAYNAIFGGNGCSFESVFELAFTNDGSDDNYLESGSVGSFYGSFKEQSNNGQGSLAVSEKVLNDVYNTNFKIFDHKLDVRYFENINPEDGYGSAYIGKLVNTRVSIEATTTNPYYANSSHGSSASADNRNWIFYRLTDVMLMQAEALIQLGNTVDVTDDDGNVISSELDDNLKRAFYLIWMVNRRSIMTTSTTQTHAQELKITKFNTKESLADLCLKERHRELMYEGKRWFDLLRQCHRDGNTNYIKNNVPAKISAGGSKSLYLNYESLFWPYFKKEVRNNDALPQKPYYGNDDDDDSNKLNY